MNQEVIRTITSTATYIIWKLYFHDAQLSLKENVSIQPNTIDLMPHNTRC